MTSKDWVAAFHDGTLDVMSECERMIRTAHRWIDGSQWFVDLDLDPTSEEGRRVFHEQRARVTEMELSFYQGLYRLLALGGTSGGIQMFYDSPRCLYWQVAHGMNGGFIFFANHYNGHTLPTGSWSIHT